MKKFRIIAYLLCFVILLISISSVFAAARSLGQSSCRTYPGACTGCVNGYTGNFCVNGMVHYYKNNCINWTTYWDCPKNTCHCTPLGYADHCCVAWGDCRPGEQSRSVFDLLDFFK